MRSENFAVQKNPEIRAKFLNNPKFGLLRELTKNDVYLYLSAGAWVVGNWQNPLMADLRFNIYYFILVYFSLF